MGTAVAKVRNRCKRMMLGKVSRWDVRLCVRKNACLQLERGCRYLGKAGGSIMLPYNRG